MGIDIDSFLDDFDTDDQNKVEKKEDNKKEEKIDLQFKEYITDKFSKLQNSVDEKDFEFLVKAYSEIKQFDKQLPSRLFELNKMSGNVLDILGKKYTQTFLQGITLNKNKHGSFITQNLNKILKLLEEKQIPKAIELYNEVTKAYKVFPKEFTIEKIELGKTLRGIEIKLNQEFEIFWSKEIKIIRNSLSKKNLRFKTKFSSR